MTLPYVSITAQEGNARPIGSGESRALVIGPSSAGTVGELYTFGNVNDVRGVIGYGPGQLAAELVMSAAPQGYGSLDFIKAGASIAGSSEEISSGSGSATIIVTGNAYNAYDVIIRTTTEGQPDTDRVRFDYSLDGGESFSVGHTVPADGVFGIPGTGLTVTFAENEVHPVGNTAEYRFKPASMNASDLIAAFEVAQLNNTNYTCILIANDSREALDGAQLFNALDARMSILNDTYRKHTQAVLPVGGESNLLTSIAGISPEDDKTDVSGAQAPLAQTTGNFISCVAERARVVSPIAQPGYAFPNVPFAYVVGMEYHAVGSDISKNPAESAVRFVTAISYDEFLEGSVYLDENVVAPRTFQGEPGFYLNQSVLKYAPDSTWDIIPKARITSLGRRVLHSALRVYLNKRIRVLIDGTGRIDPRDRARIETDVNKRLRAALMESVNGEGFRGHASGVLFSLNSENNLLLTRKLEGVTSLVPFAYPTAIEATISLNDSVDIVPGA